jgi:NAD-dependent deacetylase
VSNELVALLREAGSCVVLTGAGISTASGIPDFRSPTGVWAHYDPMEYATIGAFRRDPVKVWDFYARRLDVLKQAAPNPAHHALAELEQAGIVEAVVTQNIDRLHELAGTRELVEVHGSIRTSSCPGCGEVVGFDEVVKLLEDAPAPACPRCGRVLKPDVVMFGEQLPAAAIDRAFELAELTPLLLVVGSSLEVYPVAGLPQATLDGGGRLAIVNRGSTPYDGDAELVLDRDAAAVLPALAAGLP